MGIFRQGLTESTVNRQSINAKPSKFGFLFRAHTKVTGTDVPTDKFALDVYDHALANFDTTNPLPVEDVGDRNEWFLETTVISDSPANGTPGTVQTAFTYTVGTGGFVAPLDPAEIVRANNVVGSSGTQILVKIYKGATLIGTTRSGAANKQATFRWEPNRGFVAGDIITVTVQDVSGTVGAEMDIFFQGRRFI